MPIYHVPDNFSFEVDRLIEELRVYKVNKLHEIRLKNNHRFASIEDLKSLNEISASELNLIIRHVKKEMTTDE
jgi:hypothetical protein